MVLYKQIVIAEQTCNRCGGTGKLETNAVSENAQREYPCPDCKGKGWVFLDKYETGVLFNDPREDW